MTAFFAPLPILLSAISVGILFGFLLAKGNIANFNTIVKQLLFKDFTVIKLMICIIWVGGMCIYTLFSYGIIALTITQLAHLGIIIGGITFGIGMAILGYCPGICLTAAGLGNTDAWFGIAGMLAGGLIFNAIAPWVTQYISNKIVTHHLTLADFFGISPWIIFAIILAASYILLPQLSIIEKKHTR